MSSMWWRSDKPKAPKNPTQSQVIAISLLLSILILSLLLSYISLTTTFTSPLTLTSPLSYPSCGGPAGPPCPTPTPTPSFLPLSLLSTFPSTPTLPITPLPAPTNLDFESSLPTSHYAYWYDPQGGPYLTAFGETNSPYGWTPTYFTGFVCPGTPDYLTGRPETGLIAKSVDPTRVLSGTQALKLFTFHRCHVASIHQTFSTVPGLTYKFTIYPHAWSSNCSRLPHFTLCPLDWDCLTCMYPPHYFFAGLDPDAGVNPFSPSTKRSRPYSIYGQYAGPITVFATATGPAMTAHLVSFDPLPWRHNDVYADEATIEPVGLYYWPIVFREVSY